MEDVHDQRVENVAVSLSERVQAVKDDELRVVIGFLHDQIDVAGRRSCE